MDTLLGDKLKEIPAAGFVYEIMEFHQSLNIKIIHWHKVFLITDLISIHLISIRINKVEIWTYSIIR